MPKTFLRMKFLGLLVLLLMALVQLSQAQTTVADVEKYAEFPNGADMFFEYIKKKVQYPDDARKDSLTGDVHVEFIVGVKGDIIPESIKVVKGLSPSCDAEAVRVIKDAPSWNAATSKAAAIEQKITFPVSFVFQ